MKITPSSIDTNHGGEGSFTGMVHDELTAATEPPSVTWGDPVSDGDDLSD